MTYIIRVLFLLWTFRIVVNVISWAHVWWVKEYRYDRMLIHLNTPQGRNFYFPGIRRPHLSPKSILLISLTLIVLGAGIVYSSTPLAVTLLLADLLSFPLMFVLVGVLYIPTVLYHQYVIYRARMMLMHHRPMMVVGITGSYGKTSTKEYVSAILSSKFQTLKTEASKNSPIGIAELVRKALRPDDVVFVVEMGAYKPGEIAQMSTLVRPQVAVVTAINAQHQDLFGSIEQTMRAKYELVHALIGTRIGIFNADDQRVRVMGEWARKEGITVWWYGKRPEMPKGKTFVAESIRDKEDRLLFMCRSGKESAEVSVDIVGIHQVSNVLASIAAAVACGMTLNEAARAASRIQSVPHVLERISAKRGYTLIDDTFNNNPDAAKAALDVLSKAKDKRVLVFQPMIELGAYAADSHTEVGAYAARICDEIILTNTNWSEHFIAGVRSVSPKCPVLIATGKEAADHIIHKVKVPATILCKGKEAATVLRYLSTS